MKWKHCSRSNDLLRIALFVITLFTCLIEAVPSTVLAIGDFKNISYGQTFRGYLDDENWGEAWIFDGNEGDRVTIGFTGSSECFDGLFSFDFVAESPYFGEILELEWLYIKFGECESRSARYVLSEVLPATGLYTFHLIRFREGSSGRYDFTLTLSADRNTAPSSSDVVSAPEQSTATSHPSSSVAVSPPEQSTATPPPPRRCHLAPKLRPGDWAKQNINWDVNMRSEPSTSSNPPVLKLKPGVVVEVLEGPVEAQGYQ